MKAHYKHGVSVLKPHLSVLACLLIELHLGYQIGGATYLLVRLIHGLLQYISYK